MEIYQIRTFITVAEHGNLTKAALLLHVTQPAVSGHLKSLEQSLNLKLFERASTGVRLTKAGQMLLPKAQAILAAANEFHNAAWNLRGQPTGKARVGTILDPPFIRLGQFMSSLIDLYPWLEIELAHGVSTWAIEQVCNGSLDAAFFMGHLTRAHVQAIGLTEMAYRVVAPPAWKDRIEHADGAAIAALPWIRAPQMSPHLQMVGELFAQYKLEPPKVVDADQEQTIASLIAAGVGLGLMREDLAFAAQSAGQVCVWREARPTTTLSFIYLRERESDPVIVAMENAVRKIWLDGNAQYRVERA
ncbi:MAG: LysR family transcriptional regulator [Casimicrobiaceae bacterium]